MPIADHRSHHTQYTTHYHGVPANVLPHGGYGGGVSTQAIHRASSYQHSMHPGLLDMQHPHHRIAPPAAAQGPQNVGGLPIDPQTGYPVDPQTGMLIDPTTGQPTGYYAGQAGGYDPSQGAQPPQAAYGPPAPGYDPQMYADQGAYDQGAYDDGQAYPPGYDPVAALHDAMNGPANYEDPGDYVGFDLFGSIADAASSTADAIGSAASDVYATLKEHSKDIKAVAAGAAAAAASAYVGPEAAPIAAGLTGSIVDATLGDPKAKQAVAAAAANPATAPAVQAAHQATTQAAAAYHVAALTDKAKQGSADAQLKLAQLNPAGQALAHNVNAASGSGAALAPKMSTAEAATLGGLGLAGVLGLLLL